MNQARLLQEIAGLLEVILEETETISGYKGKIPQIELDMVMSNVRKLYQAYYDLNKINAREGGRPAVMTSQNESQPEVEEQLENLPDQEIPFLVPTPHERQTTHDTPVTTELRQEEEVITKEEKPEAPRYTIPQRPADIPEPEKQPTPQQEPIPSEKTASSKATLADKLKANHPSLYDKLETSQNGSTLADKLHQHKIGDLKTGIGINERFLLINELFGGNLQSFDEAVQNLNSFTGYPEAAVFLNHLASRYTWNPEGEAYTVLVSILKRRYL